MIVTRSHITASLSE